MLTDIQESGDALQFDGARKRYVKTEEFDTDKMNGYSRFKVFCLRRSEGLTKAALSAQGREPSPRPLPCCRVRRRVRGIR